MANPFIGLLSTPANGAKPPINVALLNTNPFSVPNKIPRGVIELVVRVPDVTEGIPVELALKVAEPVPIAVIVTVHEFPQWIKYSYWQIKRLRQDYCY